MTSDIKNPKTEIDERITANIITKWLDFLDEAKTKHPTTEIHSRIIVFGWRTNNLH